MLQTSVLQDSNVVLSPHKDVQCCLYFGCVRAIWYSRREIGRVLIVKEVHVFEEGIVLQLWDTKFLEKHMSINPPSHDWCV
jgi:hypothetical protein